MTERSQKLLDEVLSLPSEERQDFVGRLMDAQTAEYHGFGTPELAKEWEAEIARWLDEVGRRMNEEVGMKIEFHPDTPASTR
jgi:hypothetical protein